MINAGFLKRFFAYLIDILLVTIVASIIYTGVSRVFDIKTEKRDQLTEKTKELFSSVQSEDEYDTVLEEYRTFAEENSTEITKEETVSTYITLVLSVLYFVLFAVKNKGATLGKKLFNIKIVSKDGKDVTYKQLLLRGLILFSWYATIIQSILAFVINSSVFYTINTVFSSLTMAVLIISAIMVGLNDNKCGLHDLLSGTKVVKDE